MKQVHTFFAIIGAAAVAVLVMYLFNMNGTPDRPPQPPPRTYTPPVVARSPASETSPPTTTPVRLVEPKVPSPPQPVPPPPPVPPAADFRFASVDVVCGYLRDHGHKTGTWKELFPGDYFACSPYKEFGKGARTSATAYYVDGTKTAVKKAYVSLNINSAGDAKEGAEELARVGAVLVSKATGQELPKEAKQAITDGKKGEWEVGGAKVKLVRDDYPTGNGYKLTLSVES
jgi:Family of unknown function (DUF6030)